MKSLRVLGFVALLGFAAPALALAAPPASAPAPAATTAVPNFSEIKKLADARNITAQYQLAQMYINGVGVNKNPPEAYRYARMAGLQGQRQAQRLMGEILQNGLVGQPNITEAINWYKKAAAQGDALSCMHLASMYYDRNPQPPDDLATSYVWMTLAAVYGNENAKATREKILTNLGPQAIAQGNETVRQWLADNHRPATPAPVAPAPAAPRVVTPAPAPPAR